MAYSDKVFDEADYILSQRRLKAKREANERKARIYSIVPRLKQIDNTLASISIQAARAVLSGGDVREELEKLRDKSLELQNESKQLLINHNLSINYDEEKYYCSKCSDTGYVDGVLCDCKRQLLRKLAIDELNRYSPIKYASFDDFNLKYYSETQIPNGKISYREKMSRILNFCINYANNFSLDSKCLIMQGATGLGKTHLSLSIANAVVEKGYNVIYCSVPNILRKLEQENFNGKKQSFTEDSLIECDLLIFDDLGTEFTNKFSTSIIYNIINSRLCENRPTIINTNLSTSELQEFYTMRFVSRIIGEFDKLDFVGTDIRQQKMLERK